jgi:hypothetical protein
VAEWLARNLCPGGPDGLGRTDALDDPADPDGAPVERSGLGCGLEAAAVGWGRFPGGVAGLNVATESIAPATRQTARMLATSGRMVPCPANGEVSRRSLVRRRRARSSRW